MKKCERLTKYLREHNIEEDPEMVTQAIHILEFFKKDLEEHTSYSKISIISLGEAINQLEQYNPDEEDFMDDIEKYDLETERVGDLKEEHIKSVYGSEDEDNEDEEDENDDGEDDEDDE